jgi:mono/diheme cytochrome c family protein
MNYPVWELQAAAGGLLIALMAVVHVYVAHFAVGGGLFLVLCEIKAARENSPAILAYTRRHSRFFLLLTMVFGGLTGVGIWFTIALLNPAATSTLIHTFVFGWAAEWVCFVAEIVALFIYTYTFDRLAPRLHQRIGWLYFLFAWVSLFLINGIISFMLTPGRWLSSQNFWDGFFNPSMVPALIFRTAMALLFAGIFGLLTAVFSKDQDLRKTMVRYCAYWMIFPWPFILISGYWYLEILPPEVRALIWLRSPELLPYLKTFGWMAALLVMGALWALLRRPSRLHRPASFLLLFIGLFTMGSFEFLREGARRPWAIYGYAYANGIPRTEENRVLRQGLLKTARWIKNREITDDNRLEAGREIFRLECLGCHSINGPMNDILPLTRKFDISGLEAQITGLGKINGYMPPFLGTPEERQALAVYIVNGLQGKAEDLVVPSGKRWTTEIPPFDPAKAEYVLLAWNNLGMHCISDSDPYWVLLPPANDLYAQLVKRGPVPEIVTQGVEIRYRVEPGFENPSHHVRFWEYALSLFGKQLPKNVGLSGNGLSGTMKLEEDHRAFNANLIPVVPYPDGGGFNPYPLFTIEAVDKASGKILAQTRTPAPASTEMGCRNCHGGNWRVAGVAGVTDRTSADVLKVHDKYCRTDLLSKARSGRPQLCQSCHADPVLGTKGRPDLLNFPAAMHGWHANYLTGRGADACFQCHPSSPKGPTRCFRGVHAEFLDCTSCHGKLEDHALSLLKKELQAGKPGAARLMKNLPPRTVATVARINPRTPWLNEPDCLNCHVGFQKPQSTEISAFNQWTKGPEQLYRLRSDPLMGLMCEACHGSTHAVYPATNPISTDRDNIQPLQYQRNRHTIGRENCRLCHSGYVPKGTMHGTNGAAGMGKKGRKP